jgi:soluble lytic murein transglycosylase
MDAAIGLLEDDQEKDALRALEKVLEDFPRSTHRYRARYWIGEISRRRGDDEKSQKIFRDLVKESPLTYYGYLAALGLRETPDTALSDSVPLATATDPFLQPLEAQRIARAEQLVAAEAFESATMELKELKPRDALSSPFLLYLATVNFQAQHFSGTFTALSELIQRTYDGALSRFVMKLIFPRPYPELIQKIATQEKLDPLLVQSLIKQESAFDRSALSSSGAAGMMQLMPFTAVDVDPTVQRADLLDPEVNIRIGVKYLRQLIERFDGNFAYAIAGYNAGPNAVDRWIRELKEKKGKHGLLEFIESIPYKETREYVAAIIRNHFWYSRLMGARPQPLEYFWAPASSASPLPSPEASPSSIPSPSGSASES